MFICTNIYITIMQKNFYFSQICLMWNDVVFMHTIEFTSDSYNFLNNPSALHYISIFNITLDILLFLKCIYLALSTSFWYDMLLNALCFNFLHKTTLVFNSCTYTMTYNICHLHPWYIWDIYLHMNCYCLIHFTTCYYCHSPKMLHCTIDICHEISACNRYSVTSCLFIAIFMVSLNQL